MLLFLAMYEFLVMYTIFSDFQLYRDTQNQAIRLDCRGQDNRIIRLGNRPVVSPLRIHPVYF